MKTKTDLSATIQALRQAQFPDLPTDLVADIITLEEDFVGDRAEVDKRLNQVIEQYLTNLPKD